MPKAAPIPPNSVGTDRPDWLTMTNEAREAHIRELVVTHSVSQIAAKFRNVTRNAIIGKIHRMEARDGKMDRARLPAGRPAKPLIGNLVEPTRQRKLTAVPVKTSEDFLYIPKTAAFSPLPGVKPLPMYELPRRLRCRWPVDVPDTKLHFACGTPTVSETHVYCAPHRQLAIGRPTQGAH